MFLSFSACALHCTSLRYCGVTWRRNNLTSFNVVHICRAFICNASIEPQHSAIRSAHAGARAQNCSNALSGAALCLRANLVGMAPRCFKRDRSIVKRGAPMRAILGLLYPRISVLCPAQKYLRQRACGASVCQQPSRTCRDLPVRGRSLTSAQYCPDMRSRWLYLKCFWNLLEQ